MSRRIDPWSVVVWGLIGLFMAGVWGAIVFLAWKVMT